MVLLLPDASVQAESLRLQDAARSLRYTADNWRERDGIVGAEPDESAFAQALTMALQLELMLSFLRIV